MEQTIKTNNSELMQNNTVSFLNDEINSRDNNYTLFNIGN